MTPDERLELGKLLLNITLLAELASDPNSNQELRCKVALECQHGCLALQGIAVQPAATPKEQ